MIGYLMYLTLDFLAESITTIPLSYTSWYLSQELGSFCSGIYLYHCNIDHNNTVLIINNIQEVSSGNFEKYNYGSAKANIEHYGQVGIRIHG